MVAELVGGPRERDELVGNMGPRDAVALATEIGATILVPAGTARARIDAIEAVTKHDVIAFLTHLAEIVGPEARFVHQGMTSSDVLDTCLNVQLVRAADLLIADVDKLLDQGRNGPDCSQGARQKVYQQMNKILNDDAPYMFGFAVNRIMVAASNIQSCSISAPSPNGLSRLSLGPVT